MTTRSTLRKDCGWCDIPLDGGGAIPKQMPRSTGICRPCYNVKVDNLDADGRTPGPVCQTARGDQ